MLVELPPFPPPQHRIYLDVIYGSAHGGSCLLRANAAASERALQPCRLTAK